MAAYNSWNGTPMAVHPILTEVTRKEWGNNGIICTDWGALNLLVTAHKAFPTHAEGVAAVIKAGVGQILDTTYKPYIYEALEKKILTEADIDKAIRGNYYVTLRLGLLDADQLRLPYSHIGVTDTIRPWMNKDIHNFVRLVTAKSVVLLKNDKKTLPLDKNKIKSIAVIGPRANEVLLDWYSGTPPYDVTILQGIKNALGDDVKALFEPSNEMDKAYVAAQKADYAIVCVGNHVYGTDTKWKYSPVPSDGREAVDRKALSLEQEDLVKVVHKANPNTIMVLVSSFPFAVNWAQENLPAIVHISNSSQELGNGLADVIFGRYNPAGRTTQTWVKSIEDLPPMMDYDIRNGRTYMYTKRKPLYPFGYGLSYTTFEYRKVTLSSDSPAKKDTLRIVVDVKNTGDVKGEEVVQLYVSYPDSKVKRPIKQLKGFKRQMINAGQTVPVEINLKVEDLAYWDMNRKEFVVEDGRINLMIGSSFDNILLTKQIRIK